MGKVKITIEVDEAIVKNFEEVDDRRAKRRGNSLPWVVVNALRQSIERRQGKPIKLTEGILPGERTPV